MFVDRHSPTTTAAASDDRPRTPARLSLRAVAAVACALAVAFAALAPARAQQPPQPSLAINQLDASAYPDVRAVVTALDASGVPVPGLTAAQFQASDGGAPLTVTAVQGAQDPSLRLSVVLAIDVSGSMAGEPLARAKQAATDFVNSIGPNDEAALVAFDGTVRTVVNFTGDRAQLAGGIAGLQAAGATALYEAVQASAYATRSVDSPRRAVVLLTDGQNDTRDSQATADGSIAAAGGAGVPVFTVGFGDAPDTGYLQALSSATHGGYRAATAGTVADVYSQIAALLRNQYVVTMRATAPADGAQATLRLTATVAGAAVSAEAAFARGAAPAAVPTAAQPAPEPAAAKGGGRSIVPFAFAAAVVLVVAGAGGYGFVAWRRRRRLLREQLEVVAPNPRLAAAQGLPKQPGAMPLAANGAAAGRLVAADGAVYELHAGPAVIGSSARESTIVLPAGDDVAPEHVRIWLRDGRYLLHHAGGVRRKTLVAGREADWVVLEPGDEVQVGRHRFVFEEG